MPLPVSPQLFPLANVTIWLRPLPWVLLGAIVAAMTLVACYWLLRLAFPKTAAIARTTAKETMAQPLFYVVLVVGIVALLLFPFVPYNTFGEDVKMLKDGSLTVIMLLSIALAVWTASVSVSDEIEGRTALTLLSKPVSRRQFILGKFLGIVGAVAMVFVVFGAIFLATVSYKVVYDARETANPDPTWIECGEEMVQIVPGIALAFMETVVLAAISVAIATRLPMMPNLILCASIYVLGHLTPLLAESAVGQFPIVPFIADLVGTILPMLEHFNIYVAISTGSQVPLSYVAVAGLYCLLYSTLAMFLALLLFEDRDLA